MLSVGIQIISTIALFSGFLDSKDYAIISIANIAAYNFSNAAGWFKRGNKD